jgi:hypothetical protein
MVKCKKLYIFKANMASLEKSANEIIISVVQNMMCDKVRGTTDIEEGFNEQLEKLIHEYLLVIQSSASKFPGTKFAAVNPTFRQAHKRYMENHENFCKAINEGINKINLVNKGKIGGMSTMSHSLSQTRLTTQYQLEMSSLTHYTSS